MIRFLPLWKAKAVAVGGSFIFKPRLFFLGLFLFVLHSSYAQAPTSLQYPASSSFTAHVSSVYLVPSFSGSTIGLSFSISPALPAGLNLNTSNGIISGMPTTSSSGIYVVTVINSFGSTITILTISTTNSFLNNANGPLSFLDANRTFKIGNGQSVGDIAVYSKVAILNGQPIDCIVKTVGVTNVSSWSAYDQPATTGTGFSSNDDAFFSPQVVFGTGGGKVIFEFQFIVGGSYNNTSQSGTNVTLQNVALNTYDIDGNGASSSNQYNEFDGFSNIELSSASTIKPPTYDATLGLTKFLSSTSANSATVTTDATRVRLTYDNMSLFHIQVGAGASGAAYFFLDFSGGPAFATAVATKPPLPDLNTSTPGTGSGSSGCANVLTFTQAGQTNITSPTALTALMISYNNTTANLPDGSSERLIINGATAGTSSHALNFTTGSTSSVTVGGVAYTITKNVSGATNTITFTTSSTFTVAQGETLLDALQYDNSLSVPTSGSRDFILNIRNTQFISPDAAFTATLNCVTISGNIYHDANGLTDNTVNANGNMGQFAAAGVYAVLTNPATNAVIATVPVADGGAYTFGRRDPGTYNIFISNNASPGGSMSSPSYPAGNYKSTGENLGATAGNDGLVDSKITISLGTVSITNANIGVQIPPVTADFNQGNQASPGGYNYYLIPGTDFIWSDADGTIQSLTITSYPTGANYLKIGSTFYTNGGTCPPQVSCTAWPGTVTIPIASVGTIAVNPASSNNTSVSIPFTVLDDANFRSNNNVPSTVTISFVVPTPVLTVTGRVWNDGNGNGVKETGEGYFAPATAGQNLYALLIQNTNTYSGATTILTATPVSATTGYTFTNVPIGNEYEVRIVSLAAAPIDGVAKSAVSPSMPANFWGVSTNNNGTVVGYQKTIDLVNTLGSVNGDKINVNFGIDRVPDSYTLMATIAKPAVNSFLPLNGGSNPPAFVGTDPEDQPWLSVLTGKKVAITSLPANGELWYNGVQITKGDDNINVPSVNDPFTMTNFDPSKLQVKFTGSGYTLLSFNYAYIDAAGVMDPTPATYILNWVTALPVHVMSFTGKKSGNAAKLRWTSTDETNLQAYILERSTDAISFKPVAIVAGKGGVANEYNYADNISSVKGANIYYRLKEVDSDGTFVFSETVVIKPANESNLSLAVSPNPVKGSAHLTIKSDYPGEAVIRMTDYSGKTITSKNIVVNAGTTNVSLESYVQVPNSVYFLSLEMNGAIKTERFVLQR